MRLTSRELQALCEIAIVAARRSGTMIQSYAGRDYKVSAKDAGSSPASQVVTEVDLNSQAMILEHLAPTFTEFDLGLLIEESNDDQSRFEKDFFWCIDPLDGTLPFMQQQPGYAVSIALVAQEGTPVIGVVFDPLTKTLYHAVRNAGAFRNERAWVLQSDFEGQYQSIQEGGAVINACRVLENAPACFAKEPKPEEGGGALWDYAATACLFEEMGGIACDRRGAVLDLNSRESLFMNRNGVLFASHKEIVDVLTRQ